jgi:hypothetical protein
MLIIREAQMRVLEESFGAGLFEDAMVRHLREQHPRRFGGSRREELQAFVQRVTQRARSCGIEGFPGCATFLELVLEFGDHFPKGVAWAEASLAATAHQTGEQRAEALLAAAALRLDEVEARRAADMDAEQGRLAAGEPDEAPALDAARDAEES